MKPFEKQWKDHPNIALSSSSLPDTAVYSPPVRLRPCMAKKTPLNKLIFKICLPGCRLAKGEIWLTNTTSECSCQCLPIWLFWHTHLNRLGSVRQTQRRRAADGAPARKWVAKALPPDTLWLIDRRTQQSRACVLAGLRADSDKTRCWKHLHNFLDFSLSAVFWVQNCLSKTSFITLLFLVQKIILLNARDSRQNK